MTSELVNGVVMGHHLAITKMMSVAETPSSLNRDQLIDM